MSGARDTATLFRSVWRDATGRGGPSNAELQIVLAISQLESSFARGWKGPMAGSNNYGAIQCTSKDMSSGPPDYCICVDHEDHHANGTPYVMGFRFYVDARGRTAQQNGAWDFLRQFGAQNRPLTASALSRGASLYAVADAMHRERYFEGDARGGKDPVLGYAQGLERRIGPIAAELGQAPAVSLHGGADASPLSFLLLALALAAGAYLLSKEITR